MAHKKILDPNYYFKIKIFIYLILILIVITILFFYYQNINTNKLSQKPVNLQALPNKIINTKALIKKNWEYNFSKILGDKTSSAINSILKTENGYLLIGSFGTKLGNGQGHGTIFMMEINYDGEQLWYKTFPSDGLNNRPIGSNIKNSFLISYSSYRRGFNQERVKTGYTIEIDKTTHKIINKDTLTFTSIVPQKDGYIASGINNKIYYIDINRDIVWEKQIDKEIFTNNISKKKMHYKIKKLIKTKDKSFIAIGKDKLPWILKFDEHSKVIWKDTMLSFSIEITDVIQTNDNGYIVIGRGYGKAMRDNDGFHMTARKYSNNGSLLWTRTFKDIDDFFSAGLSITKSEKNTYIISGHTNYKPWLVKIDTNGNVIWDKIYVNNICKKIHCSHVSEEIIYTDDSGHLFAINGDRTGTWLIKTDNELNNTKSEFKIKTKFQ